MIDARRWIIVEAWISLGLRIAWCPKHVAEKLPEDAWFRDDSEMEAWFYYAGDGLWHVLDESARGRFGRDPLDAPRLSADAMKHELAHYLTATKEERRRPNFGIPLEERPSFAGPDHDGEERAVAAEPVIDAILTAAGRVVSSALSRSGA